MVIKYDDLYSVLDSRSSITSMTPRPLPPTYLIRGYSNPPTSPPSQPSPQISYRSACLCLYRYPHFTLCSLIYSTVYLPIDNL